MKTSELIKKLESEIQQHGDNRIVFAANKHSYSDTLIVNNEPGVTTLALYEKISKTRECFSLRKGGQRSSPVILLFFSDSVRYDPPRSLRT